ncbi:SapB/AmfS family lantipeptide [Microbispora cellulosiformans]|uniref:SapB/AmfS family lantipeptide n=1 Tax=Microbispora cellulosiformans TaxID=2614688 RepID=A0A5J5K2N2_9ACTN|nr:SapB/AmfS family lanthipeptide [Microbispora cellulosiformans]KAA9377479.1 SapB/AmfS family lantipeptide [Microbispora cellulosiformans]
MALLDLQTLEAPTGGGGTTGSNLSLLGCTPHENSSLSIICG